MNGQPRDRPRLRASPDGLLTQLIRARRIGPGALDEVRQNIARDSRLGLGYLGIGAVIVGLLLIGRGLVSFGWTWPHNDHRALSATAWLIVIGAFALAVLVARRRRGSLPSSVFVIVLAADAAALGLDQAAVWLAADTDSYLTVGVGIGATLLACVTFRPTSNIVLAVIALAVATLAALAAGETTTPGAVAVGTAQLVLSVVPTLAGVIVVRSFGELVQRELDRTVAESTIGAPRYGLGLLASTELARLDLAAEELLEDVHTGHVDLPLDREVSATASGLATDLRRMLIAGRRESWMHHAVTESAYLSAVVTLTDPDGLAGYLAPVQRDGLLSAIWLIVDESGRGNPAIDVSIGRPSSANGGGPDDRMVLPIVISIGGLTRRRVDPAVWSALSRVGQYSVEARTGSLRVGVDAHVVVPDASR